MSLLLACGGVVVASLVMQSAILLHGAAAVSFIYLCFIIFDISKLVRLADHDATSAAEGFLLTSPGQAVLGMLRSRRRHLEAAAYVRTLVSEREDAIRLLSNGKDPWEEALDFLVARLRPDFCGILPPGSELRYRSVKSERELHGFKALVLQRADEFCGLLEPLYVDFAKDAGFARCAEELSWQNAVVVSFCCGSQRSFIFMTAQNNRLSYAECAACVAKVAATLETHAQVIDRLQALTHDLKSSQSQFHSQGEFITHVAHDVRAPLQNVMSVLQLLREKQKPMDENEREWIEIGLGNCASMSSMVDDIVDYSRHQAGALTARRAIVNCSAVVAAVVRDFKIMAEMKGLELICKCQHTALFVDADAHHLRRVVSNLLSNAIKYSDHGEILVEITNQQGEVSISVRDQGRGMGPMELSRLLTPFQGAGTEAHSRGLGFVLSKALVELNHGRLEIRSQPLRGTEVACAFPRAMRRSSSEAKVHPGSGERTSILVIDDDIDVTLTLAGGLERAGFLTYTACSVQEARSILNFDCPDIILTDASMPHGGVAAILEYVKARAIGSQVFVLTGSGDLEAYETWRALGALAVFRKPLTVEDIRAQLRTIS